MTRSSLRPTALAGVLMLITCVLHVPITSAQSVSKSEPIKYWVFFADKPDVAGKTAPAPDFVTARAIDRRNRRGTRKIEHVDIPVSPGYVQAIESVGATVENHSRWLNGVSARLIDDQRAIIEALPFVREVRPVAIMEPEAPATPGLAPVATPLRSQRRTTRMDYGASLTQLEIINAVPVLESGINGNGVRIGFLDTKFGDFTHPVFANLVNEGRLIATENFADPNQTNTHGLSVASVAVGFSEGNLIGPGHGAEVLAATTEFAPTETNQEEDNLVAGLEWMESMGADVVNISLGYSTFDAGQSSYTTDDLDGDTGITSRAVDIAAALGVAVVSSAGNAASCGSPSPTCWGYVTMPADADSVIAVGAVNADSSRSSFSSVGPTADGRIKPDVSALGTNVQIATSTGGFAFSNGTSFSGPIVAGVVAQILQANPDLNPIEVRDLLRASASLASNPNNELGWGIIDANMAVQQAVDSVSPDTDVRVSSPYPNPARRSTTLGVFTDRPRLEVRIAVYNILGQRVITLQPVTLQEGYNPVVLNVATLAAGVYVYHVEGDAFVHTGKIAVLNE